MLDQTENIISISVFVFYLCFVAYALYWDIKAEQHRSE